MKLLVKIVNRNNFDDIKISIKNINCYAKWKRLIFLHYKFQLVRLVSR